MTAATTSRLRPHAGQALWTFAKTYPKLIDVILEVLQNAIDSNPTNVYLEINLNARTVTVRDDGDGVDIATFEQALIQVGMTIKGKDKLGQFGRGLVAPLGKCLQFKFTSCPKRKNQEGYCQWTFVCDDIAKMDDQINIPQRHLPGWLFSRKNKQSTRQNHYVPFRTQMHIEGIIEDRAITRLGLESLNDEIIEEFGTAIRKKRINVWLYYTSAEGEYSERKVEPPDFMGRALELSVYEEPSVGDVSFRMFVTPLGLNGRKGRVLFGEAGNDFRVSGSSFLQSAAGLLDPEVIRALRSGVFEGEILGKRVKLHPERKKFETNDALLGFCICIDTWFKQVGFKHFQDVVEQNRDRRHQKLGLRAMRVIDQFLRRPQFADLIKTFTLGSIGVSHVEKPAVAQEKTKTLSIDGGGGKKRKKPKNSDREPQSSPKNERSDHVPRTVAGPEGKIRTMVRSNSTGLQLSVEELPGKKAAYELDRAHGVLRINSRHPNFAECEGTDTSLMRYFEAIAAAALTLALYEDLEFYANQREAMDQMLELLVLDIAQGDRLSGRRATGKKTEEDSSNPEEN